MGAELVLRVNVYGLRHLTETLLATGVITSGGSIVNIASLAGMAWQRHLDRIDALDAAADFAAGIEVAKAYDKGGPAAYVLSKEWVVAYTQRLAGRLLPQRIRVNSVSPGPVITPLFPYFENDAGAEQMAWMNEQVGRAAQPEDEAEAIVLAGGRRQRLGERGGPPRGRWPVGGHAHRLGRHQVVAGIPRPPALDLRGTRAVGTTTGALTGARQSRAWRAKLRGSRPARSQPAMVAATGSPTARATSSRTGSGTSRPRSAWNAARRAT